MSILSGGFVYTYECKRFKGDQVNICLLGAAFLKQGSCFSYMTDIITSETVMLNL